MHRLSAPSLARLAPSTRCSAAITLHFRRRREGQCEASTASRSGLWRNKHRSDIRKKQNGATGGAARLAEARNKASGPTVDVQGWRAKWQPGTLPPPSQHAVQGTTPPAPDAAPSPPATERQARVNKPTFGWGDIKPRERPAQQERQHWEKAPERRQQTDRRRGDKRQDDRRASREQEWRRRKAEEDEQDEDTIVDEKPDRRAPVVKEPQSMAHLRSLLDLAPESEVLSVMKETPHLAPLAKYLASGAAPTETEELRFVADGATYKFPLNEAAMKVVSALEKKNPGVMTITRGEHPRTIVINLDKVPEDQQDAVQKAFFELAQRLRPAAMQRIELRRELSRADRHKSIDAHDVSDLNPPRFLRNLRGGRVLEKSLEGFMLNGGWPMEKDNAKVNSPDVNLLRSSDLRGLLNTSQRADFGATADKAAVRTAAPSPARKLETRAYEQIAPVAQPPMVAAGAQRTTPETQKKAVVDTARATLARRPDISLEQRRLAEAIVSGHVRKA
ncbi:hypothetical protein BD626DRAFT_566695 [Schizophyllum amplum]|uniref:Uncharacterized protein n=1 Tax=Schizophyllum amplum TaxID=97359 RepID=A0A550CMN4_9AGAR|nr:hypothetical protein BD626DRAFT_566695 [Auriculariopsis ampla]